jgi:DNA-binding GntR family transcriptional regulator
LKADVLNDLTASTSLVDRVSERVTEMIRRGELQPDAQVNINALAKQWSISLVPIREALARLSATGLLQFIPNRGYRVAPRLTQEERQSLFEAREFIEVAAATPAAKHRTDAQIEALSELNSKMRSLPSTSTEASSYAFFTLNDEFHKNYVRMSRNPYLIKWFEALSFDALISRETGQEFDIQRLVGEHEEIIAAIANRKASTIRDLLKKHIRSTRYSLP